MNQAGARTRPSVSIDHRCSMCGFEVMLRIWEMPAASPATWTCPQCQRQHQLPVIGAARVEDAKK